MTKQTVEDTAKRIVALIVLIALGIWIYISFFNQESPAIITAADKDAFGVQSLTEILETEDKNEARFDALYKGKPFIATGTFKEANKDLGKYRIAVDTTSGTVACETGYEPTVEKISTLETGQAITISGVISETWMGTLMLEQCNVQ